MQIKPISWSFSSRQDFITCPRQYHEVRVLKNFPFQENEQSRWGDRVHKAFELALRDGVPLPPEMQMWSKVVEQFRALQGILSVENKLVLTSSFTPTTWFAKDAWLRGIIDALWLDEDTARAADWKTGKRKPNSDQLKLFALLVFHHFPQIQRVKTMYVWLATFERDIETYYREQMHELWLPFLQDVKRIETAFATNKWLPKSSGLCYKHCPVVTCEYQGKRRSW